MWFTMLFSPRTPSPRRTRFAPRLDELGERTLPSATLVVTNPSDDGSSGTLRSVLAGARDGDIITFAGKLKGDTIRLTQGELVVGADITITGPGADRLSVSGSGRSRVFEVMGGAAATITGLTIRDGFASQGGGVAIDAGGGLSLTNDVLTRNNGNGMGGAVYNAGTAAIDGCLMTANVGMTGSLDVNHQNLSDTFGASTGGLMGMGGAVDNVGSMSISHSTLTGNTALIGSVTISQSTIANTFSGTGGMAGMMGVGNGAFGLMGMGGAIHNEGTLDVRQSDLAGNTAVQGSVTINHSTLTNNFSLAGTGGVMGVGNGVFGVMGMGGGIANMGTMTAEDSTLDGNVGANGSVTINQSTITDTFSGSGGTTAVMGVGNGTAAVTGMGGGLCNMGTAAITGGAITGNTAAVGSVEINHSTLSDVFDPGAMSGGTTGMGVGNGTGGIMGVGGGIGNCTTLTLSGTTVSGNHALDGSVRINHSTLTSNGGDMMGTGIGQVVGMDDDIHNMGTIN